jgi:hypothetical protein
MPVRIKNMTDAEVIEAQLLKTFSGPTFTQWKKQAGSRFTGLGRAEVQH